MSTRGLHDSLAPDSRARSRAVLTAGNKAIYPGQGPCHIGRVVKRIIDGRGILFYHLTKMDYSGGELFVPVEKAQAIGVRSLMKRSEIPQLLAHLKTTTRPNSDCKQRTNDNLKLVTTGSAFDLAEVVASLTELRDKRSLTLRESGTLERARRLLVCEISEVMGEANTAVEEQVDQALKCEKRNGN